MAKAQKDFFSRLADLGEDALARFGEVPGGQRFLEAANGMRDRLDEIQKRLRGLDALERRVAALERKLDQLSKKPATAARRSASTAKKTGSTAKAKSGK